jgi:hypothetical protein
VTDAEIKAALAICEAATPGPYELGEAGACNVVRFDGDDITGVAFVPDKHNASFFAAAREGWPRARAVLALHEQLEAARLVPAMSADLERMFKEPEAKPEPDASPAETEVAG